jgi:DNA-binding transcriptional ArsR family regulator
MKVVTDMGAQRATRLATVGSLVSDAARCRMLMALGDGGSLSARRLAEDAGVKPATASSHLMKLVAAEFVKVEVRGRYHYYCLAGREVAELIETMERLSPIRPIQSLRESTRARALREARISYDHLAGSVAIDMMEALIRRGLLEPLGRIEVGAPEALRLQFAPGAHERLRNMGFSAASAADSVATHIDSMESKAHLAGELGRRLLTDFLQRDWMRRGADSRAVHLTPVGRTEIQRLSVNA